MEILRLGQGLDEGPRLRLRIEVSTNELELNDRVKTCPEHRICWPDWIIGQI